LRINEGISGLPPSSKALLIKSRRHTSVFLTYRSLELQISSGDNLASKVEDFESKTAIFLGLLKPVNNNGNTIFEVRFKQEASIRQP
jgi:hypothetical protein